MSIKYVQGKKLQLWVRDTGVFDGFAVYLNGQKIDEVGEQDTKKYDIVRPDAAEKVSVRFGGHDGGVTAVVDVTDPNAKQVLAKQHGMAHEYVIEPV